MPLEKDPNGGGTNADGSLSTQYCSYCFVGGAFTYPGNDVKEFQRGVVEAMIEQGWSRQMAWLMTRPIPRLPRWKGK